MPANSPPDGTIRATVLRLARPDGYGGAVVERAAIVAEGPSATEIESWIVAHGGEPEAPLIAARPGRYGLRPDEGLLSGDRPPRRYVLPADALAES
jgi:hypothetical protein